jgi:hypothetical protein
VLQPAHEVTDPLLEVRKREVLCPDFGDAPDVLTGNMREPSLEVRRSLLR